MEINEQDDANKTFDIDGLLSTTFSTIKSTDNDISKSSLESGTFPPQELSDSNINKSAGDILVRDQAEDEIVIKSNGDGSDSGIEFGASSSLNNVLQRALSSNSGNSGGYASSCGGIEDNAGAVSCNSSMISYCSDTCEKTNSTVILTQHATASDCYASEGGSESSSITGDPTIRKVNVASKKKVALKDGSNKSLRKSNESTLSTRSRPSINRSNSLSVKSSAPQLATRERARSRDKTKPNEVIPKLMTTSLTRSMSLKRPPKPDSFPSSIIKDPSTPVLNNSRLTNLSRTPSLTRGRTPNDDGRWPSVNNRTATSTPRIIRNPPQVMTPDSLIIKTRIGNIQLDNKSSTFDKYATLPRRRKERSVEDLAKNSVGGSRSSSQTRNNELLPNRMTSSLMMKKKELIPLTQHQKTLPVYPKIARKPNVPKTKIYHETSVQTAITSRDVEEAFAGNPMNLPRVDAVEMITKEIQVDIRDKEMEKLRGQINKLNLEHSQLLLKLTEKNQTVTELEQE